MIAYRQNPTNTLAQTALRTAQAHYRWASEIDGQSDGEILHSIGLKSMYNAESQNVISALERTWLAMQCGRLNARSPR